MSAVLCFVFFVLMSHSVLGLRPVLRMGIQKVLVPQNTRSRYLTNVVKALVVAVPLTAGVLAANAGIFDSQEQNLVESVAKYQAPVAELLDQLRVVETPNAVGVYIKQQILRGGPEDSAVVLNYLSTYFRPLQAKLAEASSKLKVAEQSQSRLELLPALMQGHLLELEQAIREQKAESQAKEVAEIQETLAEFLLLCSAKYEVTPYVPTRALTDKELFGPLGCEFWGKKRVQGSNACEPIL